MSTNISSNIPMTLLSTSSTRIQSLERHVHQWVVFSFKLLELWQRTHDDTRKIKLKKIRFSNQCERSISKGLPRIVDMLFEVENDSSTNDQKIILSFYEDMTTIRVILGVHSLEHSSSSLITSVTSIEYQETEDFR